MGTIVLGRQSGDQDFYVLRPADDVLDEHLYGLYIMKTSTSALAMKSQRES